MSDLYVKVCWPEIQDYMDHPRWEECFSAQSIDETDIDSYWFVPEDVVEEVKYAKFQRTANLTWNGQAFTRDIYTHPIKEGDLVLFSDDNGRLWTSKCIRGYGKLPTDVPLFEGSETPGIGCYILGVAV